MQSTVWKARIVRAAGLYKDCPPVISEYSFATDSFDRVSVTVGKIPAEVRNAIALMPSVLEQFLSPGRPVTAAALPESIRDENGVYTTLVISQSFDVPYGRDRAEQVYYWYDIDVAENIVARLSGQARATLDVLTGRLIGVLGSEIIHSVAHETRWQISSPRKPAQPVLQLAVGEVTVIQTKPASALSVPNLESVAFGSISELRKLEALGRWLAAAGKESDPFKRFLWAYAGLEVLAGQASASFENDVLSLIADSPSASLTQMAARKLLYPVPSDDAKDPWRSIVFKFTMMAVAVGGESAESDIKAFERINKFRNRIHGHVVEEACPEAEAKIALHLLRKYAPLISRRLAG